MNGSLIRLANDNSLIDTNIIIKLLKGDKKTVDIFDSIENIYISCITTGELFYG